MTEPEHGPEPASAPPLAWVRALLVASLVLLGGAAVWIAVAEEWSAGPVLALVLAALPYGLVLVALGGRRAVGALGAARILAGAAAVFTVLALAVPSLL